MKLQQLPFSVGMLLSPRCISVCLSKGGQSECCIREGGGLLDPGDGASNPRTLNQWKILRWGDMDGRYPVTTCHGGFSTEQVTEQNWWEEAA